MKATVDIGGTKYILESDDDYLANMGSTFEPETVRLFRTLARGTVLDVGANIGCTALLFSNLADRVHAFEPSPSTYALLCANVAEAMNIVTHNTGLGDMAGESELTFAANNRSGGFVSDKTSASAGHVIEKIVIDTLDNIIHQLSLTGVDFIKIDVEGFEAHVIRGGRATLSKYSPIVALELNHWCLNAFQRTSVPDFFDYLRSVFPILYAIQGNSYLDLHDKSESYIVMYRHILHTEYFTLVGASCDGQLERFHKAYAHGLPE